MNFYSYRNFLLIFILFLLGFFPSCSQKEHPSEKEIRVFVYGREDGEPIRILGQKQINLDESPEMETLVLFQSGQSEVLSAFRKEGSSWTFLWKLEFFLKNLGPMYYDGKQNKWSAGSISGIEKTTFAGDCLRRIVLAELPGDNFNSVFIEVLSEEPPLGLFSVPMGYRKGKKIWDGYQLKEHEELKRSKRVEFEYSAKEKSFRIFPTNPNYSQEFVFNGWEMIANLPMQPVPSFVSLDVLPKFEIGKESLVTLQLKNRGNYVSLTYLSLSFPDVGSLRLANETQGVRLYKKGDIVYNVVQNKKIPAEYPLLEVTKEGWANNFRYGIKFYYTPITTDNPRILFRSTYKFYQEIISIPNQYSIAPYERDQQGFPSYILNQMKR
ncbi:hypothetical protein LEP1GSC202_1238 [Leptospira yanagawae serovar Saopaulo str. Sao Paulo = ATCC 700523]|uniref:Uncharacterized protein n=1 Tax=Leptospira yanagawae serovar Saopaulo str. Sao Paulo = ATCC 700523 TaxID=1249483 RepID=A0A5E8HGK1_9LEPT|nr:hypothetical protein [Leptospira yanagawae]EOQ89116.1 hypothetical protein LEP1GSC202_1238 [Leptospira yanagawae serovar Saopaulo str. Sao Paulo = ATCC 700523]